jgi:hypothetical protein
MKVCDERRCSVPPVLIGRGVQFPELIGRHIPLHPVEVKAYKSAMVGLHSAAK